MHRARLRSLITACALAFAVHGAAAQTAPPMKAGLWQIHVEREENGQKMPDASERMNDRMKSMTPEQRKQFEEMMKQHGVAPGSAGNTKLCYSQKMVERGAWSDQGGCKIDFSNRSATSWKWHSSCPALSYQGDGEASFSDSETFVVKSFRGFDDRRQDPRLEFHEDRKMAGARLRRPKAHGL
jgi:hypothetical protein